jgi:hypothetical protein
MTAKNWGAKEKKKPTLTRRKPSWLRHVRLFVWLPLRKTDHMEDRASLESTKIVPFFQISVFRPECHNISMVLVGPEPAISDKFGTVLYCMKTKCASPLTAV